LIKIIIGPALGAADFDDHKRQRKVMQPAFGSPHLRNLFPVFIRNTQKVRPPVWNATPMLITPKLVQLLRREIAGDSDRQSLQIDVYDYATRVSLDLTGEGKLSPRRLPPSALLSQTAAFEYQFGALDNKQDKLKEVMRNLE
jgi:cytochrome P450